MEFLSLSWNMEFYIATFIHNMIVNFLEIQLRNKTKGPISAAVLTTSTSSTLTAWYSHDLEICFEYTVWCFEEGEAQ